MTYKKFHWHAYFWGQVTSALVFLVPKSKSILFIGPYHYDYLKHLQPREATIVCENSDNVQIEPSDPYELVIQPYDEFTPKRPYDVVILFSVLGFSADISSFLSKIKSAMSISSRMLIYQHNHLWMPLLQIGGILKIKNKELTQNWLSIGDITSYLYASGIEVTRSYSKTLIPARLFFVGSLFNALSVVLPFFDFFKLNQFIMARKLPTKEDVNIHQKSLTICLTVSNEKGNIEPIVKSLPIISGDQEVLFVEGHSSDGTREEIERVRELYPEKNVRVIGQPGIGQGDAIRAGFDNAEGDIIILFEGDCTSDPNDIRHFYNALATGWLEFVEGSRFVYPLSLSTMPIINRFGNMLFSRWFSWFLKGHMTDVLSGIKAISKGSYQIIGENWGFLGMEDPFGDFELLYGAARFGLKFGEIPMKYYPRKYGVSKTKVYRNGLQLLRLVLRGYFVFRNLSCSELENGA